MKELKIRPSQKLYFMRTINNPHNKRSLVRINTKFLLKFSLKHNILIMHSKLIKFKNNRVIVQQLASGVL